MRFTTLAISHVLLLGFTVHDRIISRFFFVLALKFEALYHTNHKNRLSNKMRFLKMSGLIQFTCEEGPWWSFRL